MEDLQTFVVRCLQVTNVAREIERDRPRRSHVREAKDQRAEFLLEVADALLVVVVRVLVIDVANDLADCEQLLARVRVQLHVGQDVLQRPGHVLVRGQFLRVDPRVLAELLQDAVVAEEKQAIVENQFLFFVIDDDQAHGQLLLEVVLVVEYLGQEDLLLE